MTEDREEALPRLLEGERYQFTGGGLEAYVQKRIKVALARTHGEPVAWRFRTVVPDYERQWNVSLIYPTNFTRGRENEVQIEPLYASPPAQAVPEGWMLVPKEATHLMNEAAEREWISGNSSIGQMYRAMLSAAPKPGGIANICPDGTAAPTGGK